MVNTNDVITTTVSVVTGTYALANIQDILSIIILVISILNILWTMIYRIYNHVKEKRYDKISKEIEDTKNELEKLKEKE